MKNYKAHYILSWFRTLLRGNSPTSSIFVIEKMNNVTMGEVESSRSSLSEKGKCPYVHLPEG
jgi:hypothetical protein